MVSDFGYGLRSAIMIPHIILAFLQINSEGALKTGRRMSMSDGAAPPSVEGVAHVEELRGRGSLSEHLREKFTLPAFILSVILTSALLWRAHSLLRRE